MSPRTLRLLLLGLLLARPAAALPIYAIQGAGHTSPFAGHRVETAGVVTALAETGFYLQDPTGDADPRTSDGIFVATDAAPPLAPGDRVTLSARVQEALPGDPRELGRTQLVAPSELVVRGRAEALPAPVLLGIGGRPPPAQWVEDDGFALFQPDSDAIDFYESLEGMRVALPDAVAVGPRGRFGHIPVLADARSAASGRGARGALAQRAGDANPERIPIDGQLLAQPLPRVDTGDRLGPVTGVLGYSFGRYQLLPSEPLSVQPGGLAPERTDLVAEAGHLRVASFNVRNLGGRAGEARFRELAELIHGALGSPQVIALQEIGDSSGGADDGVTDADLTGQRLVAAIGSAGGPAYRFADLPPEDGADGGPPGSNIRVGYLYDPSRVELVPGSLARLDDPAGGAFDASRKPLLARFRMRESPAAEIALVNLHLSSRRGGPPQFGTLQPAEPGGEARRIAQALWLRGFAEALLADEPSIRLMLLGDLNALGFEPALSLLAGAVGAPLFDLAELLPEEERYSFLFDGNALLLDHALVSPALLAGASPELDLVHVAAEFWDQASDHDPLLVRLRLLVPEPGTGLLLLAALAGLASSAGRRPRR